MCDKASVFVADSSIVNCHDLRVAALSLISLDLLAAPISGLVESRAFGPAFIFLG